jgi:hypothetical protein
LIYGTFFAVPLALFVIVTICLRDHKYLLYSRWANLSRI